MRTAQPVATVGAAPPTTSPPCPGQEHGRSPLHPQAHEHPRRPVEAPMSTMTWGERLGQGNTFSMSRNKLAGGTLAHQADGSEAHLTEDLATRPGSLTMSWNSSGCFTSTSWTLPRITGGSLQPDPSTPLHTWPCALGANRRAWWPGRQTSGVTHPCRTHQGVATMVCG